ncbi:MAG: S-layer homology domain-containing protein [Clostridiales bacterium]|nr:S-layer homology domain-containing protein [Clostridiales bacterium]
MKKTSTQAARPALTGLLFLFILSLALCIAAHGADEVISIEAPAGGGAYTFTVPLAVVEDEAYAGIECVWVSSDTSALKLTKFTKAASVEATVENVVEESGLYRFGAWSGSNAFHGRTAWGEVEFEYTGADPKTITLTEMLIARFPDGANIPEGVKLPGTVVIKVSRASAGSGSHSSGGGGSRPAITIGEAAAPLAGAAFAPFITGFEDNTFRGSQPITREQFVAILYRLNAANPAAYAGDPSFNDVSPGRWSYDAIEWASGAGVIEADENGNFRPAAPLTRADMAVMFVKVEKLTAVAENIFSDIESHPAAEDILKAVEVGIFNGYPDGTFKPEGSTTRSEAVAALIRYLMDGEPKDAAWQNLNVTFTDVPRTDWAFKYIALAVIGNSLPPR